MRRTSTAVAAVVAVASVGLFLAALLVMSSATSPRTTTNDSAALAQASAAPASVSTARSKTAPASPPATEPTAQADEQPSTEAAALEPSPQVLDTVSTQWPPTGVAYAFDSLWVTTDGGGVKRVDPAADRVVATVPEGGFPVRAAGGFGSVWVANCGLGHVLRINPETNRVIATIDTGDCPFGVAAFAGSLWVANADDHVSRIDPSTNDVSTIHVRSATCTVETCPDGGDLYRELAVGYGAVWTTTHRGRLLRIDPRTNRVTGVRVAPGLTTVTSVTIGFGTVWATVADAAQEIVRVAPRTMKVTARLASRHGRASRGVAFGDRMWFGHGGEGETLAEGIDPSSNRSVAEIASDGTAVFTGVFKAAGSLWASSYTPQTLYRIAPVT
jgi:YVTN family beta-propeller protein